MIIYINHNRLLSGRVRWGGANDISYQCEPVKIVICHSIKATKLSKALSLKCTPSCESWSVASENTSLPFVNVSRCFKYRFMDVYCLLYLYCVIPRGAGLRSTVIFELRPLLAPLFFSPTQLLSELFLLVGFG